MGETLMAHVPTAENCADLATKVLSGGTEEKPSGF